MSKAARNRANRAGQARPNTGAPANQVFPNFPYERRFTHAEIHEDILPRAKRIGDAMRDGVAPSGAVLYIPGDMFEMWMIHAALAGVDVDEDKAYIRARRMPDASGRLAEAVEWVVKKEDSPEARQRDAEKEADAHMAALERNLGELRPEVADIIRRRMKAHADDAAEFLADAPEGTAVRDVPRDFGAPQLVQFKEGEESEE